jgi:hypothetical protein
MAYEKHGLLGLNKSGSSPARGKPNRVHDTAAMPTVHPAASHGPTGFADKNIARDGAPKKQAELQVHSGMHARTRDGDLIVGRTHTTVLDDGKLTSNPIDPGKKFLGVAVKPSPGMRNRAGEVGPESPGVHATNARKNAGALHEARAQNGQDVLSKAVQSGSTKLPTE